MLLRLLYFINLEKMKWSYFFLVLFFPIWAFSQVDPEDIEREEEDIRVMFYNVENIFDPKDDPNKRDEEFTSEGDRNWDNYRFYSKLNRSAKALLACGGWQPADIIGICEIENRFVLEQLIEKTVLKKVPYEIVHFESRDRRGIDVGLLYHKEKMTLLHAQKVEVNFPWDSTYYTRDILWATFQLPSDTLHVFVNHWPSRWGGQLQTEPARVHAAKTVRLVTDSLFAQNPMAKVIVMGDFNDGPQNRSIKEVLLDSENGTPFFFNLMEENEFFEGSHKYQAEWGFLDQIIVSHSLLRERKWHLDDEAKVCGLDFLLMPDEKYLGIKPKRSFIGFTYQEGFSDHLPVFIDLEWQE